MHGRSFWDFESLDGKYIGGVKMDWKKICFGLIRWHYEGEEDKFDKIVKDIEVKIEENEGDLASYLFTLRTGIGGWLPGGGEVYIMEDLLEEVKKYSELVSESCDDLGKNISDEILKHIIVKESSKNLMMSGKKIQELGAKIQCLYLSK